MWPFVAVDRLVSLRAMVENPQSLKLDRTDDCRFARPALANHTACTVDAKNLRFTINTQARKPIKLISEARSASSGCWQVESAGKIQKTVHVFFTGPNRNNHTNP
jgi:hypothetical protein